MKNGVLGVAVVGCGLIGAKRVRSLPPHCRLVSAFDISRPAADRLVADVGAGRVSLSLDDCLADPEVDLVIIATRHSSLAEIAIQAAANKKHVLVEKPGALAALQLQKLLHVAESSGVVVRVGYNHRFHPSIRMAKEIIDSSQYGDLLWLRARYGHGGRLGYEKEWRAQREESGGGELLDQGSHLIDLCRHFFGDVRLEHSHLTTAFWDMRVEDNAFVQLTTPSGGVAWMHASWTEWKNTFSLEINLRSAKIEISGLGGSYGVESLTLHRMKPEMGPPMSETWSWDAPDSSWSLELADFLNSIAGAQSTGAGLDDAIATLVIIEQAYSQ